MTHRQTLTVTGGVVIALYVAVMILAVACSFGHVTPAHDHHQHSSQPTHSALCLWACQANVGAGLLSAPDDWRPQVVALEQIIPLLFVLTIIRISVLRLRGPPLGYF